MIPDVMQIPRDELRLVSLSTQNQSHIKSPTENKFLRHILGPGFPKKNALESQFWDEKTCFESTSSTLCIPNNPVFPLIISEAPQLRNF